MTTTGPMSRAAGEATVATAAARFAGPSAPGSVGLRTPTIATARPRGTMTVRP